MSLKATSESNKNNSSNNNNNWWRHRHTWIQIIVTSWHHRVALGERWTFFIVWWKNQEKEKSRFCVNQGPDLLLLLLLLVLLFMVCLTLSISRYFRLFKGKVYKSDIYDLKELSLEIPINLKLYFSTLLTLLADFWALKSSTLCRIKKLPFSILCRGIKLQQGRLVVNKDVLLL